MSFEPSDRLSTIEHLQNCVSDKLQFNDSKTEMVHINSRFQRRETLPPIEIDSTPVESVLFARNLGVLFDSHLEMKERIKKITRSGCQAVAGLVSTRSVT